MFVSTRKELLHRPVLAVIYYRGSVALTPSSTLKTIHLSNCTGPGVKKFKSHSDDDDDNAGEISPKILAMMIINGKFDMQVAILNNI